MVGIFLRYSSLLRILSPIATKIKSLGGEYVIFIPKNANKKRFYGVSGDILGGLDPDLVKNSSGIRAFDGVKTDFSNITDAVFVESRGLLNDGVIELFRQLNIRKHNILYFTETLFTNDSKQIITADKVYYPTKYIMDMVFKHMGVKMSRSRDKLYGLPIFEGLREVKPTVKDGTVIVLLPSFGKECKIADAFGKSARFHRIISLIKQNNNVVLKTRDKIYMPGSIIKGSKEVLEENESVANILKRSKNVVLFYSNGIYEYVLAGANVVNIPIKLPKCSGVVRKSMEECFCYSGPIFNYPGVVDFVGWKEAETFTMKNDYSDTEREKWINKFIGLDDYENISLNIAKEILQR